MTRSEDEPTAAGEATAAGAPLTRDSDPLPLPELDLTMLLARVRDTDVLPGVPLS
jgi:hypothetical protein